MRTAAWKTAVFILPLTLFSAATLPACAPSTNKESKIAKITPGEMPAGAKWDGVYYNEVFGYLHMVESNPGTITGRWKTADGTRWGELAGTTEGNLLRFQWTEHKIGMVGPTAISKGKGVFVYKHPEEGEDNLKGVWGLDDSETGNEWDAIKQKNQKPDLKSIKGTEESGGPSKEWKSQRRSCIDNRSLLLEHGPA